MKRFITLFLIGLTVLLWMQCGQAGKDKTNDPIATTIFPVYDWTRELLNSESGIINILPQGANPHHFEPSPQTIRDLQNVRLFIGIDREFDGWVESLLPDHVQVVYLAESLENDTKESHEMHHHNPHYWLSVRKAKVMVEALSTALKESHAASQDSIDFYAARYLSRLDTLDQTIRTLLKDLPNKSFIQWHPAWNYFAEDYGLSVAGTLSHGHGDSPSIKEIQDLVNLAKKEKIRLVVQGLFEEQQITQVFARETQATLLTLDTMGNPDVEEESTYIKMMNQNARLFAEALQEQP